ncbi:HEAT repeat domain-containing protein [Pseudomonadota bacterium]
MKLSAKIAFIPSGIYAVYSLISIIVSADAQGPIALIFLPVATLIVFGVSWGITWSITELYKGIRNPNNLPLNLPRFTISILVFGFCSFVAIKALIYEIDLAKAESINTHQEVLEELYINAIDPYDHDIMMRIAENRSSSPALLRKLSRDKYLSVRYRVAANTSTPEDILIDLSSDSEWVVRAWLATNPSASLDILELLKTDENEFVRKKAIDILKAKH